MMRLRSETLELSGWSSADNQRRIKVQFSSRLVQTLSHRLPSSHIWPSASYAFLPIEWLVVL